MQDVRGEGKQDGMPTDSLGIPHAVTQSDEYMGYKPPGRAGVMRNVW